MAAVKEALLQIRGGIDVEHKKWYDCAVALGDTINVALMLQLTLFQSLLQVVKLSLA